MRIFNGIAERNAGDYRRWHGIQLLFYDIIIDVLFHIWSGVGGARMSDLDGTKGSHSVCTSNIHPLDE